jgi:hypothetical protein
MKKLFRKLFKEKIDLLAYNPSRKVGIYQTIIIR